MKQVRARLAAMAGAVVLTAGLPALAGPAYGAGQAHSVARPTSGLARLERLGRGALFHDFLAASAQGELTSVDVRARADGWAVGLRCTGKCQDQYTLIEHWNGRRWSRVPSPSPSRIQYLGAVRAVSARDAWAVGFYATDHDNVVRTLIEHWNGRRWTRVPSPNPSTGPDGVSALEGVTAVSGRDAWAAGLYGLRNGDVRPLLLHWNGVRWSAVPSPHRSPLSTLMSVSATSAGNAWAVGESGEVGTSMLLMHWNGVRWSLVPGLRGQTSLQSVSAVSARDAWAAGVSCPDRCNSNRPPIRAELLHWNGTRWARAVSPEPGADSELTGVSGLSARDAWAVGEFCHTRCQSPELGSAVLLLHWNGVRWARATGPGFAPRTADLGGVSTLSARRTWAVGLLCSKACFRGGVVVRPLILRWNGRRWAS